MDLPDPVFLIKSLLSTEVEVFTHSTTGNEEVSSTKSLTSAISPCGKLLTYMRKNKGPNTEPCVPPLDKK